MNYTITPSSNKYQVSATLYEGKAAEFIAMLMQNNKFSSYLYFDDKELLSKFSYMYVQHSLKDEGTIITGMIVVVEVDAKLIEAAIKETKKYIDKKLSFYQDIFSTIDMYIKHREPLSTIEMELKQLKQTNILQNDALKLLKDKTDSFDDGGTEDLEVAEPFPFPQPKKLSIFKKLFNMKGGDDNANSSKER